MQRHSALSNVFFETLIGGGARFIGVIGLIYAARTFGATNSTDIIYYSTSMVVIFLGFFTTINGNVVLPQFLNQQKKHGEELSWQMLSSTFTYAALIVVILCTLIVHFFEISLGYVSNFSELEIYSNNLLASILAGTLFCGYTFDYLATICRGYRNFLIPNVLMLFGAVAGFFSMLLSSRFLGPTSIALSLFVSQLFPALLLWAYLFRRKHVLRFRLSGFHGSRKFIQLIFPHLIGQIGAAIVVIYPNYILTGLEEGALTSINYARRIFDIVPAMLIIPVVSALSPNLSDLLAHEQPHLFARVFRQISSLLYSILIPLTVFVYLYANLIVGVVFDGRNFSLSDQGITADALRWYFAALLVLGSNAIITKAIVMTQNIRLAYIGLSFAIAPAIGVPLFTKIGVDLEGPVGVAAAYAIYLFLVHQVIGYIAQSRLFGVFSIKRELISIFRPVLYSIISGIVAEALLTIMDVSGLLALICAAMTFALCYLGMHAINKTDEFQVVTSKITIRNYAP